MIVNDEIRVLADFNRAHALINAQLNRGIDGDELQSFLGGKAAVLHRLGGFLIQMLRFFRVIGVDGNNHPLAAS